MTYSIEFIKTVLNLSNINDGLIIQFLLDIKKYFPNDLNEYNKIIKSFAKGKRQFLNREYNNFINENKYLLNTFVENNVIDSFIFNDESYVEMLKFMKYIMFNICNKDKMLECVNELQKLKIDSLKFVEDLPYAVTCSETKDGFYHRLYSAFTDGKNTVVYTKRYGFTTDYIIDTSSANYIIFYSKDNMNGVRDICVYVKNLEFEASTLPTYNKLHNKNSWQNINSKSKIIKFQK